MNIKTWAVNYLSFHDFVQKQKYIQKELIKKKKKIEKTQKKVQKLMESEPMTDLDAICRKIINAGLLDDMCDDYNTWMKVGFAIFNSVNSFELFDLFSAGRGNKQEINHCV